MRRKLSAAILLLVILVSMVLPFGEPKKALAVEGSTVLGVGSSNDYCTSGVNATFCTYADGMSLTQIGGGAGVSKYSDAVVLEMTLSLHTDGSNEVAHDQESGPNMVKVDWQDIGGGNSLWGAFYNVEDFTAAMGNNQSSSNGFFLRVGTAQTTRNEKQPPQKLISTPITNFVVRDPAKDLSDPTNDFKLGKSTASDSYGGANMLKVIATPATSFFGNANFSRTVAITGLQPNTTYYFQMVAEEAGGSNDYYWGNLLEIKTQAEGTNTKYGDQGLDQDAVNNENKSSELGPMDQIDANLECVSLSNFNFNPVGCLAELFVYGITPISEMIAHLTGSLFDGFAAISLGSTIYGQGQYGAAIASFVENSWSVVRDISNIFFIFILLYAALGLVLSLHHFDTKKLVAQTIIIALVINFSLFFCRVAIDTSNVLSRVFYNAMGTTYAAADKPVTSDKTGISEHPISGAIIGAIQPQSILSGGALKAMGSNGGSDSQQKKAFASNLLLLMIVITIVNFAMAWIFFMCAAFFAGRIGVIWLSMIFAPLAFVSSIVPGLDKNLKQLGWHSWLSSFMAACFKAPVFFFFIYLIINLVGKGEDGILGTTIAAIKGGDGSWIIILIAVLLPMMILIGLLQQAKKIAEEMAGEFGGAFAGIINAGVGLGAMAITGGAAIAGRSTLGALSAKIANPESAFGNRMRDKAAGTGLVSSFARLGVKTTEAGKKASFDIRNTGAANALSKATGVDMDVGSKVPLLGGLTKSFSTANTAGGMEGKMNRQAEKDRKMGEMLGFNKTKHDALEKKIDEREDNISKQEDTLENLRAKTAEAKAKGPGGTVEVEELNPTTGKMEKKDRTHAEMQVKVTQAQNELRKLKKGETEKKWTAADVGTTTSLGKKITAADVGKTRIASYDDMGHEAMKKAKDNMKIARAKEYLNNRILASGKEIHHDPVTGLEMTGTRDAFGNIKQFAHVGPENDWKRIGRNMRNDLLVGLATGGAIGGLVAGPVGMLAGAGGFGLARVLRTALEDGLGGLRHDIAHLASDTSHKIHIAKSDYKSPTSGFTDMFKGVGGGGGGHGHDDHSNLHVDGHGHGGDDHH